MPLGCNEHQRPLSGSSADRALPGSRGRLEPAAVTIRWRDAQFRTSWEIDGESDSKPIDGPKILWHTTCRPLDVVVRVHGRLPDRDHPKSRSSRRGAAERAVRVAISSSSEWRLPWPLR